MLPPYASARAGSACDCNGQARKRNISCALFHYFINLQIKCIWIYNACLTLCNYYRKQFVFRVNDARYAQKDLLGFFLRVRYCQVWTKTGMCQQILAKYSQSYLMKNQWTVLELLHTDGRTHTQGAGHKRIIDSCRYERATNTDMHLRPQPIRTHDTCATLYPIPHIEYAQDEPCVQAQRPG